MKEADFKVAKLPKNRYGLLMMETPKDAADRSLTRFDKTMIGLVCLGALGLAIPSLAQNLTRPAAQSAPAGAPVPNPVPFPNLPATQVPLRADPTFIACVNRARAAAVAQGAPEAAARNATINIIAPDPEVIAASQVQPEFRMQIWDYLAGLVDDERVADGSAAFATQQAYLRDLGNQTGVDPATVAGVWGVETNFGRILGKRKIIPSLATLGCTNWRRTAFFNSELVAAIRVQAAGHVAPEHFIGSWAGAFGQTQFMPSTFWRLAVDGNGDGRRDIIDEPRDALASTANYLRNSGWVRGQTWGYEVRIPAGYRGPSGRTNKRPLTSWSGAGFVRGDGSPLPDNGIGYGLITPAGLNGPGFLVGRNFDAVYAYNPAESYALAVNLLADRIKGGPGVVGRWPTDDLPLQRAGRRELQGLLLQLGYDIGVADGIVGPKSRSAIADLQRAAGMVVDGRAGEKSLTAAKAAVARATSRN
jgi:lytic murein transglycosylase